MVAPKFADYKRLKKRGMTVPMSEKIIRNANRAITYTNGGVITNNPYTYAPQVPNNTYPIGPGNVTTNGSGIYWVSPNVSISSGSMLNNVVDTYKNQGAKELLDKAEVLLENIKDDLTKQERELLDMFITALREEVK
jgi:hypothetical protein